MTSPLISRNQAKASAHDAWERDVADYDYMPVVDSTVAPSGHTQLIVKREPRLSGTRHLITDSLLKRPKREVVSLPEQSRAAVPWWERADPYWETQLYDARHQWQHTRPTPYSRPIRSAPYVYDYENTQTLPYGFVEEESDLLLEKLETADDATLELWRRALGLVCVCGVISDEQLTAILHDPTAYDKKKYPSLWNLAELEALEGSWHHPPGQPYPRSLIWRINNSVVYRKIAADLATSGKLHHYFGGIHPTFQMSSILHIRHQCLSNELAIRALEASEMWAGWLPEALCHPEVFVPYDHPARHREHQPQMRPDGCLVRLDGGKVFIEVQASNHHSAKFSEKVMRWSQIYNEGLFGGIVLFVAASHPNLISFTVGSMKSGIEKYASPAAMPYLLVGQWTDYSPDHCQITADAIRLRAARYGSMNVWEETDALTADIPNKHWYTLTQTSELKFSPAWVNNPIQTNTRRAAPAAAGG